MTNTEKNGAGQFANDFLNDIRTGKIKKECMMNHFQEFSEGLEELHRERFCMYLKSCGCFLMNRRLEAMEEAYHG